MKRCLFAVFCLLPALLLTACGQATELTAQQEGNVSAAEQSTDAVPDVLSANEERMLGAASGLRGHSPLFENITDEETLRRLFSGENADYVPDYQLPAYGDAYSVFIPEEAGGGVDALQAAYPNSPVRVIEENDCYILCAIDELDMCPVLVMQQMHTAGNGYVYYDGSIDEANILRNFDLLTHDRKLLDRAFRDDPEIKCIAYEFYEIRENDTGTATLGWYNFLIDRDDRMFSLEPEWNQMREISLEGLTDDEIRALRGETAADVSTASAVCDIELTLSQTEILIGQDDPEIVVRAVPPAEYSPESIMLYDADTDDLVSKLVDDCDYAAHGDNIQGDGWYCNRYTVPTDFGTDPEVSEDKTYRFYAAFEENGVLHCSETISLWVTEGFTDKELSDMERVDDAIAELLDSDAWKQADTAARREMTVVCIKQLAEQGLIDPASIYAAEDEDTVAFTYACGVSSMVMLKSFDPMLN